MSSLLIRRDVVERMIVLLSQVEYRSKVDAERALELRKELRSTLFPGEKDA